MPRTEGQIVKKQLPVRIPASMADDVRKAAEETGRSQASIVEEAISVWLSDRRREKIAALLARAQEGNLDADSNAGTTPASS